MRKTALIIPQTILLTLFVCINSCGQETEDVEDYPADMDKYAFTFYGGGDNILAPQAVVRVDNNWEILLACLEGKTKSELQAAGIDFRDSQLMLLLAMQFLELRGNRLKTTLPILGAKKMGALREEMRALAVKMDIELRPAIEALRTELNNTGRESSTYTILFCYALDSLPWDYFEEKDLVFPMQRSLEKPLWNGVYWAYYPERETRCGTNSLSDQGVTFKLNWSEEPIKKIFRYFNWNKLGALLEDYLENGRIVDEALRKNLAETGIFDSVGKLTIPIIIEREDNQLYSACREVADKTANLFLRNLDLERLKTEFDFNNDERAIVVSYHEWMWEYLDYLEKEGLVRRPFAFSNPEEAGPEDIGALLFVVDGRSNQ